MSHLVVVDLEGFRNRRRALEALERRRLERVAAYRAEGKRVAVELELVPFVRLEARQAWAEDDDVDAELRALLLGQTIGEGDRMAVVLALAGDDGKGDA
jgi:hypothetical protein